MKKKVVSLLLVACLLGSTGCNINKEVFDPWDNLGGGGIASDGELASGDINDYAPDSDIFPDFGGDSSSSTEDDSRGDSSSSTEDDSSGDSNSGTEDDSSGDSSSGTEDDSSGDSSSGTEDDSGNDDEDVDENKPGVIDLSQLTADNAPAGTSFKDGTFTIKESGTYELTGK